MAYREPQAFARMIDILVEVSSRYLVEQLRAGADAVQIFDTWAGVLPTGEFERWCVAPVRRMVENVRARGSGGEDHRISARRRRRADALSRRGAGRRGEHRLDGGAVLRADDVQSRVAVQGNLDPLVLLAGGAALDRAVDDILENYGKGPLIFNLGHGILPPTPIAHVEQTLRRIRESIGGKACRKTFRRSASPQSRQQPASRFRAMALRGLHAP